MAFSKAFLQMIGEYQKPIKKEIKENKKESNKDDISIYRGYIITKAIRGYTFPNSGIAGFFKTEEEAMNRIDSIERERVKETNASIQRVDAQVKR